jgi:hypothetical protein
MTRKWTKDEGCVTVVRRYVWTASKCLYLPVNMDSRSILRFLC